MKKIFFWSLVALLLASCSTSTPETPEGREIAVPSDTQTVEQIQVTASLIPLASVINAVGGEFVAVNTVVPAGVSPHGFDLSPKDLVAVADSDIIVTVGDEHIDGFMDPTLAGKTHISFAEIEGVEYAEAEESREEHHDEHQEDEHHDDHKDEHHDDEHHDDHEDESGHDDHDDHHHHDHGADPHLWLSQKNMNLLSQRVADILSEKLPEQADTFASNAQAFESDLASVYSDFATQTAGKTANEFIVFHDAYDYMFASASIDTELKRVFSEQLFGEIGTAHTQELIDAIAEHSIVHIYREPQMSDTALQNFATEYNLTVGVLDPIGQDASATGYIENIRSNLNEISQVYE